MTEQDRDDIEMPERDDFTLDELFERLERMPVPEGYKVEIVEGSVHMSPQRRTHWKIVRNVMQQLDNHLGQDTEIDSDVRCDFPGYLNGFAPDLAKVAKGAVPDARGQYAPQDIEFILEVVSRSTAANDYGPKLTAYACAGVPAYLIADPYTGRCHLYRRPKDGAYASELTAAFGETLDLSDTPLGCTLATDGFPREGKRGKA